MNVVLIGYRGSGKTSVGRLLAEEGGCSFVDVDGLIVHQAGISIADLFAREGESAFREREQVAIKQATAKSNRIISVGGGAVESSANRKALRTFGTVCWLAAPAEVLWERIQADPASAQQRPDLAGGGLDEIRTVLARRTPLYAQTAHFVVQVGDRTPREVMSDIQEWLAAQG